MKTIMQIVCMIRTRVIVLAMNGSQKKNEQLQVSPVPALLPCLQLANRHEENRALYFRLHILRAQA